MSLRVALRKDNGREVRIVRANQGFDMVAGCSTLLPFGEEIQEDCVQRTCGRQIAWQCEVGYQDRRMVTQAAPQAVCSDGVRRGWRQTGVEVSWLAIVLQEEVDAHPLVIVKGTLIELQIR